MIDILFTPTNPISTRYHVTAQTLLGHAWIDRYCVSRLAYSQKDIRQLTARLDAQGLSFRVDWAFAIVAVA